MNSSRPWHAKTILGVAGLAMQVAMPGDTADLTPVADTSLFESAPSANLGRAWLAAGSISSLERTRALVRFDPVQLPADAGLAGIEVTFTVVRSPAGALPSEFELRRVLGGWVEGTKGIQGVGTGGPADPGEATWVSRGPGDWSGPGGALGADFASEASAVGVLSGSRLVFPSTPALVADVDGWRSDPEGNHGWVLLSRSEGTAKTARRFGSRETPGAEPRLTATFAELPPSPPRLTEPSRSGDTIRFGFVAEGGHAYTVETTADPVLGPWLAWTNLPAVPAGREVIVEDALLGPGRFYRVSSP